MKRRILSAVTALLLAASLLPSARAAQAGEEEMAQVLAALDIMTGNQYGDLMLDREVTRAEFTKLVVAASPYGENVGDTTAVSPYPDVPYTYWPAPYVEAAKNSGLVRGNLAGLFEPDRSITLQEGVTMAVRLLGYQDSDFSGAWPAGQMALYHSLDLDEGISLRGTDLMTRRDAMKLFYNLLTAPGKTTGAAYVLTLNARGLTAAGEIDRVALVNAAMSGPAVVEEGWQSRVNFDVASAKVYRDGRQTALSALRTHDVVYWSKSMRTLWAYSDKVTGRYQAVSPSTSSPTAVTVAGRQYALETADAAYALSSLGPWRVGDTVTLLLGRDGAVAAVADPAAVSTLLVGVISAVEEQRSYVDAAGNPYTSKAVSVTATDGAVYTYPVAAKSDWKAGDLVRVSEGTLAHQSGSSISGRVNNAADRLGSTPLAENVEILDVDETGRAVALPAGRLAGMELESDQVRYVRKNAAGEIEVLILRDATGDLDHYGVLTQVNEVDTGLLIQGGMYGVYTYDVGGVSYTYQLQNKLLNLTTGPVKLVGASLYAPETIRKLTETKLLSVDAQRAVTGDNSVFPVWESAAVYVLEKGVYRLSSLERVKTGFDLTGWYDALPAEGGRIRIIVARPQ